MAKAAAQHLDRHRAPRAVLLCGVHHTYSPGADRVQDETVAELAPG